MKKELVSHKAVWRWDSEWAVYQEKGGDAWTEKIFGWNKRVYVFNSGQI
jgi:hypothetical protein